MDMSAAWAHAHEDVGMAPGTRRVLVGLNEYIFMNWWHAHEDVGMPPDRENGQAGEDLANRRAIFQDRPMTTLARTALASDLDSLIAISRRTIDACYRPFLGDEAVDAFLGSGAADRYVAENIGRCSVLVRDGEIVGYAACRGHEIDLMMIDHTVHRQGLGTELLRHVERALWQRSDELRLESFEGNEEANAFYRKNGWREVSRYFDFDSGVNKVVFQKKAGANPGAAGGQPTA